MKNQNLYAHLTAKERTKLSFPARILFERKLLKGNVLDFGCGFGGDVNALKKNGIEIEGFDKHYFPDFPTKKFDTIICIYVLNVLFPEEQGLVLLQISRLLKPEGRAYFAVRRDLKNEGFRIHKIHKKPTYQCNVKLPCESIFKNDFTEIYSFEHYNEKRKTQNKDCPFCSLSNDVEIIAESASVFAIYDKFPVNKGHVLIIPKRHAEDYFYFSFKEQSAIWFVLNFVKRIIQEKYNPDGFNIGVNIGESAGQTVPHVHIHLIPRYDGDVDNPRGGVRGVIPKMQNY